MRTYKEADVQAILLYWDFPKWTTEKNAMMVKDLFGKCYTNGVSVSTTLGGDGHRILGDLMSTTLYVMVSGTLFTGPQAPIFNTPPTATPDINKNASIP